MTKINTNEMLEYLTPTTLEEMYKDIDNRRLALLKETNDKNAKKNTAEYGRLGRLLERIEQHYVTLTGEALWAKVYR